MWCHPPIEPMSSLISGGQFPQRVDVMPLQYLVLRETSGPFGVSVGIAHSKRGK